MSESGPRIRAASPEDGDALGGLAAALAGGPLLSRYGVSGAGLHADLVRLLPEQAGPAPSERLILVEQGAELRGLARFTLRGQLGRGGYLKLIALAPGNEGQGLGPLLLDEVERQVGLASPDLFLLTSDFNLGAQRFYERRGYSRIGELAGYVRADITEILYWKRVRPTP